MKLNAEDCARLAMDLADGPPIPYILGGESLSGMDCQGLIEYVVRRLGGKMAHAGSNDMYRNACAGVWPLKEAQRTGRLTPGAVLFIVKKGGGRARERQPCGLVHGREA